MKNEPKTNSIRSLFERKMRGLGPKSGSFCSAGVCPAVVEPSRSPSAGRACPERNEGMPARLRARRPHQMAATSGLPDHIPRRLLYGHAMACPYARIGAGFLSAEVGPTPMAARNGRTGKTQNRGNKAKKLLKIKDITF